MAKIPETLPTYFDVHTHLNLPEFEGDWQKVGERALKSDTWLINVGVDLPSSRRAIEIAKVLGHGVWASVGLHPHDQNGFLADWEEFKQLAANPEVVAIGECGLDYFRLDAEENKERQKTLFRHQIELALELGKPLMVHCRDAYDDLINILQEYKEREGGEKLRGNIHFFAGGQDVAESLINMGFTLSFTGVITFANQYDEVIREVPLGHLLAETDAPFVTPVPYRGQRNEPLYVREVAERLAELKKEEREVVLESLVQTAIKLFFQA